MLLTMAMSSWVIEFFGEIQRQYKHNKTLVELYRNYQIDPIWLFDSEETRYQMMAYMTFGALGGS